MFRARNAHSSAQRDHTMTGACRKEGSGCSCRGFRPNRFSPQLCECGHLLAVHEMRSTTCSIVSGSGSWDVSSSVGGPSNVQGSVDAESNTLAAPQKSTIMVGGFSIDDHDCKTCQVRVLSLTCDAPPLNPNKITCLTNVIHSPFRHLWRRETSMHTGKR